MIYYDILLSWYLVIRKQDTIRDLFDKTIKRGKDFPSSKILISEIIRSQFQLIPVACQ